MGSIFNTRHLLSTSLWGSEHQDQEPCDSDTSGDNMGDKIEVDTGKKKIIDVSFASKIHSAGGTQGISVVSKKRMADTPENYAKLRDKFSRIEASRLEKEKEILEREQKESDSKEKENKILTVETGQNKRIVFITHFNVFMYATCYWIQSGTLPYLTKKLGADPVSFGHLQTVFAIAQLLGGPIYGRLGDIFGERTALITAFSSSVLTYLLTGVSYSLPILFLSRLPSVFLHVMQGSQMVVTALSSDKDRAAALARLGFSYGIGMVIGPTIGGLVTTNFGEYAAAFLAAAGSSVSLVLVILYVPNIPKQIKADSNQSVLNLKKIFGLILLPKAGSLLLVKTVCGIPIGIMQSMFSLIAMEQFKLPADQNGMLLSYIGGLSMFMQGIGISAFSSRFSDLALLKFSSVSLVVCYYLLSLLSSLQDFMLLQIPMVCSLSLINSILQSSLTKSVPSSIRTVAPTIGGSMMANFGYPSIGHLGMGCNM